MFNLRSFIMTGLKDAVGRLADYQIILNATGWYDKGVLLEEDLAELNEIMGIKNTDAEKEDMAEALEILGVSDAEVSA